MNNLIPTPRTDKNGRTVIRHMKSEPSAVTKLSLPPVVFPSPSDYTEEQVLDIFGLDEHDDPRQRLLWIRSVRIMRQSEEVTALALELIGSGSEGVASVIRKRVDRAAFSIQNYSDSKTAYPDWENRCREAWGPKIIPELIVEWARVTVMESLDVDPDSQESDFTINERIYGLHFALTDFDKRGNYNKDFEYWRGLSLLYFAGVKVIDGEKEKRSAIELAAWLNQRDDPAVVISLARERNLHSVEGLEYILEQGQVNRPLSPGLL